MALLAQGIKRLEHAEQWPRHAPGFGEWHQQPL